MVLGLRGTTLPHGRSGAALGPSVPGAPRHSPIVRPSPPELHSEQPPHRRETKYEPCEPSTSSLADFGARVTLERLYAWSGSLDSVLGGGAFLVTLDEKPQRTRNQERSEDYFANVGDAIRSLRDDIPMLFQRELNYDIYREDIVFRDPRNSLQGLQNYQRLFWSLRFHGKIFFQKLYVDVKRIWQPEDGVIKMRWTVHGIPRVPWEAEGTFDGISSYRLDSHGKIYEHSVDNILLRDPPMAMNPPLLAGLNLQPLAGTQTPVPGAWCQGADSEAQWGSLVQRLWGSAMHHLDQEPEPTAAVAGLPASSPASMAQQHLGQSQHSPAHQQTLSGHGGVSGSGGGSVHGRRQAGADGAARR
ncbi:hypothetical protein HYH03_013692 [Edaphochlamys debaryana]|uniref:Uncharacterized protein n=1 Tax=Edaphochlamys debaryana TaxID=47281 RepID=A0A836BU84_9CHLO|nr:hypothetical protein HYH03_013692 [Edaphochlamys debaryana]|eukprot:KAG2487693.1 hypothetical protein HYH03_013692 [Edaphochlamys debaryana]